MDSQARLKARYAKQAIETAKRRKGGNLVGLSLGAMAIAIYGYSMHTIKQESVIRQIDEEIERS